MELLLECYFLLYQTLYGSHTVDLNKIDKQYIHIFVQNNSIF